MKLKATTFGALVCVNLILFGCGMGASGPQSTVREFYQYMNAQQADKALSLFSNKYMEANAIGKEKLKLAMEAAMKQIKEEGGGIRSIDFGEDKITGDTAQVTCTITLGNGETSTDTFDLVRENGVWKLNPSK